LLLRFEERKVSTMVIFVAGLVGVGKSSIARLLADRLSLHYYDIDEVKKVIYPQDPDFEKNMRNGIPFKEETRLKVFQKVAADFSRLAENHKHLIVDETLHLRKLRQVLFEAAKACFGGYVIIWVRTNEAVIEQRLKTKTRKDHILTNPLQMYRSFAKEFEEFDESHIVCENNSSVEEATESLVSLIRGLASLKL
jgi:gluconate kinase